MLVCGPIMVNGWFVSLEVIVVGSKQANIRPAQMNENPVKRDLSEKPDLGEFLDEVKHRVKSGEFKTAAKAQHAMAREFGFAGWTRLKQFVVAFGADMPMRAAALVKAACQGDMVLANALIAADPHLTNFDLYTSCVTGEFVAFEKHLDRDPELARHKGGPLEWQPILYACFSRFLRT